ncbi:hypothetical protein HMPREF2532_01524 [Bacteroides ovatus]|nr:hypothetical protein HMPREF2532_01524 [Bacteroides ovatus]
MNDKYLSSVFNVNKISNHRLCNHHEKRMRNAGQMYEKSLKNE